MMNTAVAQDYLDQIKRRVEQAPAHQVPFRTQGMARLREGLPSVKSEAWRFSKLRDLLKREFELIEGEPTPFKLDTDPIFDGLDNQLTFVDGVFRPESSRRADPGIQLWSELRALPNAMLDGEAHANAFRGMNGALLECGGVIEVNGNLEQPIGIRIVNSGTKSQHMVQPRILVLVQPGANARLLERFLDMGDTPFWTNAICDIQVGPDACLDHDLMTETSSAHFLMRHSSARVAQGGTYRFHQVTAGGGSVRNDVEIDLGGSGANSDLFALMLGRNRDHLELRSTLSHRAPGCTSDQYVKGVYDNYAHGVFTGRVLVDKGAQKTDANQTNRNLLLNDNARTDAMPQLEIYADDVKCSHGATTGNLDPESMFYLQSRGISPDRAREMLIYAFAHEIVDRLSYAPVAQWAESTIASQFGVTLEAHP